MHPFETASERVDCARPAEAVGGHLFADLYGVGKTAMTVTGRFSCSAVAFEMNKTFAKTLIDNMERYSNEGARADTDAGAREASSGVSDEQPRADDKIRRVRGEVEEVKQVMTDNIDRILERGDKIELLVDKSQDLSEQVVAPALSSSHSTLARPVHPGTFPCLFPAAFSMRYTFAAHGLF